MYVPAVMKVSIEIYRETRTVPPLATEEKSGQESTISKATVSEQTEQKVEIGKEERPAEAKPAVEEQKSVSQTETFHEVFQH